MYKKILVPHEGWRDTAHALDRAVELVKSLGAELWVLGIVPSFPRPVPGSDPNPVADEAPCQDFMELETRVGGLSAQRGLHIRVETRTGHAVHAIVQFAREQAVDLIVLGDTGRAGIWGPLLENSAERMSLHAGCDVLLVR